MQGFDVALAQLGEVYRLLRERSSARGRPSRLPIEWTPPVAVWEGARETVMQVELAGVPPAEVIVRLVDDLVVVTGERAAPSGREGTPLRARMVERPLGPFRRVVALPKGARRGELSADFHDGVLELRVPRDVAEEASDPRPVEPAPPC